MSPEVQSLFVLLAVVVAMAYVGRSLRRWVRRVGGQEEGACGGCSGCEPDAASSTQPDAPRLVGLEPPRRRRST